jgi:hypothetical protein
MDSPAPFPFAKRFSCATLAAAFFLSPDVPAEAAKRFKGPVEATVIEIIDGDTFLAEAHVWPGHSVRVNIRVRGIDAPEMKSRCERERLAALHARRSGGTAGSRRGVHIEYWRGEILRPRSGGRRDPGRFRRLRDHARTRDRAPIPGRQTAKLVRLNQYGTEGAVPLRHIAFRVFRPPSRQPVPKIGAGQNINRRFTTPVRKTL